ncbi:TetR/AcrR family transcriptional regulator C-terminal domain-containing protein [Nonomuraea sp. NPDC026600]|uniref:TetR/AcrR family transcriptional regulator n=1 Tax=Nonomuraea sp. NPDC026600 TaxID=3155363 RepID=UPI0033E3C89E
MTSLWERLEETSTAARQALSAQRIAAAAVAIADAEGLDAITMRRLATELGVAPMSAYRHVSGKDDVLELMVDLVYGEVNVPDGADWRETLRALAMGIRALVLKHPWLTRLSTSQMVYELTPNRMDLTERALAALHSLNLDVDTEMSVFRTVAAYVHGATSAEIGLRQLMDDRGWTSGDETRAGLSGQMTWLLNTGRYPAFQRYVHEGARKDDLQWQFETGLEHVLDGIAARLG